MARVMWINLLVLSLLIYHVTCKKTFGKSKMQKKTDYGKSAKIAPDSRPIPNDPPMNDGRGFPVNNGKLTGRAKVKRDKLRYEDMLREEDLGHGSDEEREKLYTQMEFMQWVDDYTRSQARPPINEAVYEFIDATGKSVEQIEDQVLKKIRVKKAGRRKRSTVLANAGIWDKCIIPYVIDPYNITDPAKKVKIRNALAVYEHLSGFRFKNYNDTGTTPGDNSQWGLSHSNYLRFVDYNGCWSYVGNLASYFTNGQSISPCFYIETMLHELGHAIGFMHENVNPISMEWMRTNYENIQDSSRIFYNRISKWSVANFDESFYDASSIMHYGDWTFNKNYGKTMTFHDSDDQYLFDNEQHNLFYLVLAAQPYHGCFNESLFPSCATLPTCSGGGGVSIVDGVCKCLCPEGLDPSTGCTTKVTQTNVEWPLGTYSLLKTHADTCPTGFSSGYYRQIPDYYHWQGGTMLAPAGFDWYSLTTTFCTKTNSSQGSGNWPMGSYCIKRYGGSCPTGFTQGNVSYYATGNNINGVLPDGSHNGLIENLFCCRSDGAANTPMNLPFFQYFILYRKGGSCQKIANTDFIQEYYNFQHAPGTTLMRSGTYADLYSYENYADPFYHQHFNIYYCVYIPLNNDGCGIIKTFTETETNYTFTTPNYPSSYPQRKLCMWHFTSPEGTTMRLDFDDFAVSAADDELCSSYVEVKNWEPGFAEGFKFCGHGYQKTIWTKQNSLSVKFVSDGGQSWTGFTARVTVVHDDGECFTGHGGNGVYAGTVNYVKEFKPCLPWNEVTNCSYNQFDTRTLDDDIAGNNYCRRTHVGQRPWCYIDAETCEMQECDACETGKCFDIFTDCAALITVDPNFCTNNELGEAKRGCMQSCQFCASHTPKPPASQISCSMPEDVQGISPNIAPNTTSFSVGETVEYTCPTTGYTRSRVCTSEGTWTKLLTVCGVCPNGWSVFEKRCYKWLGYTEAHNYWTAKTMCEDLNAGLPKIDSAARNQYLYELVDLEKLESDTFWVGLKKRNGETFWSWRDSTPLGWSNWNTNQPDGTGECVSFRGLDGKWEDNVCETNIHYVVCEIDLPDADCNCTCEDSRDDCAYLLGMDPDSCVKHPDYAWHNCRQTCAIGACSTGGTCDDSGTDLGNTGDRIRGTDIVNVGDYTEYACNNGYYHTAGDLKRACLPNGTLTGSAPTCSTPSQTTGVELFPNVNIRRRKYYSDSTYIMTSDNANMVISIPGNITTWKYYSNHPGQVAFIVLRPKSGKYEVVGMNIVTLTADDRKSVLHVPAAQQIIAKQNDMIALYFQNDEISYTMCSKDVMPENTGWKKSAQSFTSASTIVTGTQYTFNSLLTTDYGYCRFYSIQATVQPSA